MALAKILGITGTLGAGKGEIVKYLINQGYKHFSVRDFLKEQMIESRIEPTRDNFRMFANDLRKEYGGDYIVRELYKAAELMGCNAIIESIRTKNEINFLENSGAVIISVDADRRIRYQRILARNSETDHVSFETFRIQEDAELESKDPDQQNLSYCMNRADKDFKFINDGTLSQLHDQIDLGLRRLDLRLGKLPLD